MEIVSASRMEAWEQKPAFVRMASGVFGIVRCYCTDQGGPAVSQTRSVAGIWRKLPPRRAIYLILG